MNYSQWYVLRRRGVAGPTSHRAQFLKRNVPATNGIDMASAAMHSSPRKLELERLLTSSEPRDNGANNPWTRSLRLFRTSTYFSVVLSKTSVHTTACAPNICPPWSFGTLKQVHTRSACTNQVDTVHVEKQRSTLYRLSASHRSDADDNVR